MPQPPKADHGLADAAELAEALRPVLQRLFRGFRRESHDLGVSPLHVLLLVTILRNPGVGVGELARIERLRGPTISGHVKSLEGLGLVERGPPDPGDRRRVGFHVTAKGTELIAAMKRSRTDWLAARLAGLTPEARAAIRAALPALEGLAP